MFGEDLNRVLLIDLQRTVSPNVDLIEARLLVVDWQFLVLH